MKVFVVLSALVAVCVARPSVAAFYSTPTFYSAPTYYNAPAVPVVASSQYHAQDTLGQYNYGYSSGVSAAAEARSLDGVTRGGYSYVDPEGKVQHVEYTADAVHGFRAAGTNIPVAPKVPEVPVVEGPKPVEDTPEVAQARSEHFVAVEEAKKRNEAAAVVDAVEVGPYVHAPVVHHPLAYSYPVAAPAVAVRYAAPAVNSYSYSVQNLHHAVPYYGHYVHPVAPVTPVLASGVVNADGDTVEVAAAKVAHAAAHVEAKARLGLH